MPPNHTERAFEDAIVHSLTSQSGWIQGDPKAFDAERAFTPTDFFAFLEATQAETLNALRQQHGADLEGMLLDALVQSLEARGTLEVLRHDFKFFGKTIHCAYFAPAHGMNPDIVAKYEKNRLVVARQVHFAAKGDKDAGESVDLLFSLNGFPIATAELKNPFTNQQVRHAIEQYRGRNPRHALFRFKRRALVHFAVDPDLVYMATKLEREKTYFLPFNRGANGGAGNPEHESGYRAGYLWQEVLERASFLDIVGRFIHLVKDPKVHNGRVVEEEKLVFPRYHQLDSVRKLEQAARRDGAGHSYLIQHSAGSGKSNSIAWLAYRLSSLHDAEDRKLFDSVVVITDRRVLDKQLQNNIYQFDHKQGVVARIDKHSDQLAKALTEGTPIVITTLQKFPFVTDKIGKLPGKRYAVIIDEAHSSQSGESARTMKEVLAAGSLEEALLEDEGAGEEDNEERVLETVMASRGRQKNLSFFAFTATPKAKTLEVFGTRDEEGKPRPFHLYSMRQAIEENFILDVLKSYTTYKAYYRLVRATENDPRVPKKEATRQLARFMSLHPHNIAQKTEVMVEHFRAKVQNKLGGRAKAMLVTSSRLHAVRYRLAFEKYIKEKGYDDIGVLVAFSGTVKDPETGTEHTEPGMNKGKDGKAISEAALPAAFDSDDYRVLLVANKYQTGFDQPLLHTMYVDKRLAGVQAVQTLSRLNRTCPGKEDTFVLDFVNEAEEIQASFQPYYEETIVAETADPQRLYELSYQLEESQVFWKSEVEAFAKAFFSEKRGKGRSISAEMNRHINPSVDRFKALLPDREAEQEAFRNALGAFVRLYAFLSQIMPFSDPDLEKLYAFARYLETKLPRDEKKAQLALDGDVALKYYRLEKLSEGALVLRVAEPGVVRGPVEVGTKRAAEEVVELSRIIDVLNERVGTEFKEQDELFWDQVVEVAVSDEAIAQRAQANSFEHFALPLKGQIDELVIDRMDQNQSMVSHFFNDSELHEAVFLMLAKRIYAKSRSVSK